MQTHSYAEILKKIVLYASKEDIQRCVNECAPHRLGYLYPHIIEECLLIKRGTSIFGTVISNIFSEFKVDVCKVEDIKKDIKRHKVAFENTFSPEKKEFHKGKHNELVFMEREILKPISRFVRFCNKVRR